MKKILFFVFAIAQSITIFAQSSSYNDVVTFDLKGKVKSCAVFYISQSQLSDLGSLLNPDKEYKFSPNGKFIPSSKDEVKYEKMHISSIQYGNGLFMAYNYINGKLSGVEMSDEDFFGIPSFESIKYFYDDKNLIIKEKWAVAEKEIYYSDYKVDSKGNWTSRLKKNKDGSITGAECRKIVYY